MLLVLFCVVSITFFLMRLSPGGPFDAERKLPPAIEHQLLLKYHLDGPLWQQYTDYLRDLLHGDLRLSTKYRNCSVLSILAQTLPTTFLLGALSLLLTLSVGLWLGALSATHPRSLLDYAALCFALLAISFPAFVLGPLLILIFSIGLHWLPVGGWGSPSQLILPTITLSLPFIAVITRLLRDSLREVLQENFMRTANAKGLTKRALIYRHALRVAILPIISYTGPLAANLLTGSIVVETIFHIPGAGGFFVNAILNRDGFLLGGVVIVYCALLIVFNFLVDLAYHQLDPRIRAL
ncbi:MAG: ABC transporter permease subunit [Chthoniobacterales bacterium]|nr:ABC transporter permease subunit [Chthoniobacterales bacterium]